MSLKRRIVIKSHLEEELVLDLLECGSMVHLRGDITFGDGPLELGAVPLPHVDHGVGVFHGSLLDSRK